MQIDKPLSDVTIRKLKPDPDKRQEVRDLGAQGLYLLVQPTGALSWAYRYSRNGRVLKTTLGPYPAVTLAEARRQALQIRAAVANGADPQRDKKATKAPAEVMTVRGAAARFLKEHTAEKNGDRWAAETRRYFEKDILPAIGDKPVKDVGKADIRDLLRAVKNRGEHGAPIAANRTLAVARKLFRWCLSEDHVDVDPTVGLAKPGVEQQRDRVLTDDELARVSRAAEGMTYPFGPAVRMLILTGARREEVGAMRWSEVDLDAKTWTLPSARSKNGLEHVTPLSDDAAALLRSLPRIGHSQHVFTTTGSTPISGWSAVKDRLDAASGVTGWTLHDLRRTMATGAWARR